MINPSGGCLRALALDEEEEYEEYIAAATINIQADAFDYAPRNNRGVVYFEMGEMSAAREDFTAACNLAPHESSPLLNRAGVLEDMGDFQGALTSATEAIHVAPTNFTAPTSSVSSRRRGA